MDVAPGTVALLRFENNAVNEVVGGYTFSALNAVAYDNVIFQEGLWSASFTNDNQCIHSDANITETIITIEFYLRPTAAGHQIVYTDSLGTAIIQVVNDGRIRFWAGGYSGTYNAGLNAFYHVAMIYNDGAGGSEMFINNISRITKAVVVNITNTVNHFGNRWHLPGVMAWHTDFGRLSDVLQPGPYPTTDPVAGGAFMQPGRKVW